MSYKTTLTNRRAGSTTSNILYSLRGSIVASSTTVGSPFNVADQNPNTKWKASSGAQTIKIDTGANTPVVYIWFKPSSDDLTLADVTSIAVQASTTGAFAGEEVNILNTSTELNADLKFQRYIYKIRVGAPYRHYLLSLTPRSGRNSGLIEWGMSTNHPDEATAVSIDLETNELIERPLNQVTTGFDGIPTGGIHGNNNPIRTTGVIIGGTVTNYTTNSNLNDRFSLSGWVTQTADSVSLRGAPSTYNSGLNIRYGGFTTSITSQIKSWDIFSFRTHGNLDINLQSSAAGTINGYSHTVAGNTGSGASNACRFHVPLGDTYGVNVTFPDQRETHGCFEFNNSLHITAGGKTPPATYIIFDPRNTNYRMTPFQVWESRASTSGKTTWNTGAVGNKGIIVGGQENQDSGTLQSSAEEYDTTNDYYISITASPWGATRLGNPIALYNRLHLISFANGSGPLSQHNYYDLDSRSYVSQTVQPTPRISAQNSSF